MVALRQLLSESRSQDVETVMAVLREHPELTGQISAVTEYAERTFPGARAVLEARQYDEWDPPLMLTVTIPSDTAEAYRHAFAAFYDWLGSSSRVNESLIAIYPAFAPRMAG